jgi:hypothetical protein
VSTTPPEDPNANKAVIAAIGTIVTVGVQAATSGSFELDQEGIVALTGALTTVLVWLASNFQPLRRAFRRS